MKAAYARRRSGDLMVAMSQGGTPTGTSRACPKRGARLLSGAGYWPGELEIVPLLGFQREFCSQAKQ